MLLHVKFFYWLRKLLLNDSSMKGSWWNPFKWNGTVDTNF